MSASSTMNLRTLLDAPAAPSIEVSGLAEDSRQVRPGDAFIAVKGAAADGHDHAAAAIERGAVCVLAERPLPPLPAPVVRVADLKARRGVLAAKFYREPSRRLVCIGVTGTNGKTSVAHQTACLAQGSGWPAGYLGTLGWGVPAELAPSRLTTEGAVNNHKRLACLQRRGCRLAALEVSSHALAQDRVAAVDFDYAVFTNLSRDHLDYHRSLADYGAAKRRLFEFPSLRCALVNVDDGFGRRLAASLPNLAVVTYGRGADLRWERLRHLDAGVRGRLQTPWGLVELEAPVCGDFGVANLTAAVGVLAAAGQPLAGIAAAARRLPGVPGRMEFFRCAGRPTVVVDYAHTPDALAKALVAARPHCAGRLRCVIGCGGDRDRGKRPLMAQAALAGADLVWLTSDNPRSEDPATIIGDMAAGLDDAGSRVVKEIDRAAAIQAALNGAAVEDLILVAGKGHEEHQQIEGRQLPFSDRALVRRLLGVSEEAP